MKNAHIESLNYRVWVDMLLLPECSLPTEGRTLPSERDNGSFKQLHDSIFINSV